MNREPFDPDDSNDVFEFFRMLMNYSCGITYPRHIFDRRINLLTKKEMKKYEKEIIALVDDIGKKFQDRIENDIDSIMSERAEKCNDEWK